MRIVKTLTKIGFLDNVPKSSSWKEVFPSHQNRENYFPTIVQG